MEASRDTLTPMMAQYRKIRSRLPPGTILFFRLGDFYEMFFEDAQEAAAILDIALTRRQNVPMCGVPYHAVESYLAKLLRAGKKVAVCDQMEDPALAKGIVRREVTSVVTPGTATQDALLTAGQNNYLGGFWHSGSAYGLAMLDFSTGSFWVEELGEAEALGDLLRRYGPRECVVPEGQREMPVLQVPLAAAGRIVVSPCEDWLFRYEIARDRLTRRFGVSSLDGFGCEGRAAAVGAAGAVLHYVQEVLRRETAHIRGLRLTNPADFMVLDESTCRNLDLIPFRPDDRRGPSTLLGVLDVTRTAMGARLLREWILRPLARVPAIVRRQDGVEALLKDRALLHALRESLGGVRDLDRLIARLGAGTGNARDLRALGQSLAALPAVRRLLEGHSADILAESGREVETLPDLAALIERAIVDEPPLAVRDGGIIRRGYNAELDALRATATEGRSWLAEYQAREQARTGIKTLKVRHNKVFGYYIEVSKGQVGNVPPEYARKQTLVNGERFVTPELKEYENRILGATERSMALEYELFVAVRDRAVAETARVQQSAAALARLDALAALADRALALRYVRPRMTAGDRLLIREGRHPVVEQMPDAERFVPNDTLLDGRDNQIVILTGPNMAGKSTYVRQVGVIAVMAHIGSFVPAAEAEIGLLDRVFTRVGASDDITRGRSTFMVEMQETANILHNATPRSLIILDEIGRGTSTFDGISIAWAVAEYLHNTEGVRAKTLFATHYHELTDLAATLPGVRNCNVLVSERNDQIAFLRRIVPGSADKSYGIQVARLAGLPAEVIERAKEILANLEEGEFGEAGQPKLARHNRRRGRADRDQLSLFHPETAEKKSGPGFPRPAGSS